MIEGTGMDKFCLVGDNTLALRQHLKTVFQQSFGNNHIDERIELLKNDLSNERNALKISTQLG